jgi:hypothetical protein
MPGVAGRGVSWPGATCLTRPHRGPGRRGPCKLDLTSDPGFRGLLAPEVLPRL